MQEILDVLGVVERRRSRRILQRLLAMPRLARKDALENAKTSKVSKRALQLLERLCGSSASASDGRTRSRHIVASSALGWLFLLLLASIGFGFVVGHCAQKIPQENAPKDTERELRFALWIHELDTKHFKLAEVQTDRKCSLALFAPRRAPSAGSSSVRMYESPVTPAIPRCSAREIGRKPVSSYQSLSACREGHCVASPAPADLGSPSCECMREQRGATQPVIIRSKCGSAAHARLPAIARNGSSLSDRSRRMSSRGFSQIFAPHSLSTQDEGRCHPRPLRRSRPRERRRLLVRWR